MKVGQYCIQLYRGMWRIRRCSAITATGNGNVIQDFVDVPGECAYDIRNREDALRRSFELNGWRWPPRKGNR